MKKSIYLLLLVFILSMENLSAQPKFITITFTGDNNGQHVSLDSVYIRNLSQGTDTMLYDTSYVISVIHEKFHKPIGFEISGNYPNPFSDHTRFDITIPERTELIISVCNPIGQKLFSLTDLFDKGCHSFSFYPGIERFYILSVSSPSNTKSIKLLNNSKYFGTCRITCNGLQGPLPNNKSEIIASVIPIELGDDLLMVGYSELGESGFVDAPENNMDYTIQFATNIPCPDSDSVHYEGQWYHTIQIFSQCWLKENLNVGDMILSSKPQSNNGTIEKYCMDDMISGCDMFGGLYFWNEMMQYVTVTGGKGICPDGWHVPDDMDWQILEGAVDSEYGISNPIWNNNDWRGADAGGNLKQAGTSLWEPPNSGAIDAFGFCALPAGYFVQSAFWGPGYKTYLWSSDFPGKYYRNMDWNMIQIKRDYGDNVAAFSVRCVKY